MKASELRCKKCGSPPNDKTHPDFELDPPGFVSCATLWTCQKGHQWISGTGNHAVQVGDFSHVAVRP